MESDYSVIIRTRNSAATIVDTLWSLKGQSLPPQEIIVVDNGSVDETLALILKIFPDAVIVNYPVNEDFNYSKALNLGLERVGSNAALLLSSHVILTKPSAIERAAAFLKQHQKVAGVRLGVGICLKDEPVSEVVFSRKGCSNRSQLISMVAWRSLPFAEWIPTCEDRLWQKQLIKKGWKFAYLAECVDYRNPYLNLAKKSQEDYVVARYVDSQFTSLRNIFLFLRIALQRAVLGPRAEVLVYYTRFRATLAGLFRIPQNIRSDSYRHDQTSGEISLEKEAQHSLDEGSS